MFRRLYAGCAVLLFLLSGCHRIPEPLSYDPPGSTDTRDKPIDLQEHRVWHFPEMGLYIHNRFEGARLSAFTALNDTLFEALILPENAPINNSPWYAFAIHAVTPRTVWVRLTYREGTHRYHPKVSWDGETWKPLEADRYIPDTTTGTALLRLDVGPDTLWVTAQELITSSDFAEWTQQMAEKPWVTRTVAGTSAWGKPIYQLTIGEGEPNYVLIISRQHPPEVTGSLALMTFLETLAGDSEQARAFRKRFTVVALPLMNPDGVDEGHWRHNAHGVDLNRDWYAFHQPETRLARDRFLELKRRGNARFFFALDFHSTQRDIFYTFNEDIETRPAGLTKRWLEALHARLPEYPIHEEPGGLGTPVSKNWFYRAFGIPAVTYEVGDEDDREHIRRVATAAAEALMDVLLATP